MKSTSPESPSSSKKRKPRTGVTRYDPKLALLICERIATLPLSLFTICEAPDMPGVATIFRWVREHPEFREMYVMAKETQAEILLEEAIDLVDDDSNDLIHTPDGKIVFNRLALQRCKMQVEHRRWIAAKLLPQKYGTHPREKGPAAPPSPAPDESSASCDDSPPVEVMTEEYRMKLIAARREKMDRDIAAAEAAAAKSSSPPQPPTIPAGSPSPNSDPQHSEFQHSARQPSTSRPPGSDPHPAPPPPAGTPTGHNPKPIPMYDVPRPRRELSTMNKACS